MGDLSGRNFGLLIAYVLPGFVALWGLSYPSEAVRAWLFGAELTGPGVGSVVHLFLASVACGMTSGAVRWAALDWLHHRTGVPRPRWDDSRLPERLVAYEFLIEIHYRYFQFYGNSLVSMLFAYSLWRRSGSAGGFGWVDLGVLFIGGVSIAGSRDALRKYYSRTLLLLGTSESETPMTNGGHHGQGPKNPDTRKSAGVKPAPARELASAAGSPRQSTAKPADRKA